VQRLAAHHNTEDAMSYYPGAKNIDERTKEMRKRHITIQELRSEIRRLKQRIANLETTSERLRARLQDQKAR
jgi:phage shock protein A